MNIKRSCVSQFSGGIFMGWTLNDLTAITGAPASGVDAIVSYDDPANKISQLAYVGSSQVHLLQKGWNSGQNWQIVDNDITNTIGAPSPFQPSDQTNFVGYLFSSQGTRHLIYMNSAQAYELWWDGSWHYTPVSADAGGIRVDYISSGYTFEAQKTQHSRTLVGQYRVASQRPETSNRRTTNGHRSRWDWKWFPWQPYSLNKIHSMSSTFLEGISMSYGGIRLGGIMVT
jgi:hypothetical protein